MTPQTIRNIREALGETQGTFAQRFGVSRHTVGKWERGKAFPSPTHRQKLERLIRDGRGLSNPILQRLSSLLNAAGETHALILLPDGKIQIGEEVFDDAVDAIFHLLDRLTVIVSAKFKAGVQAS